MRTGRLDHVLTIQKPGSATSDGQQRTRAGFEDVVAGVPAGYLPKDGREAFDSGQQVSTRPARFWFHYIPALAAIDTRWRVFDGSDYWSITSINWNGRTNDTIELAVVRDAHNAS